MGWTSAREDMLGKPLSPREIDTLRACARRGSITLAAPDIGMSRQTVKNHLSSAYAKLGVTSLGQALYRLWLAALWGEPSPAALVDFTQTGTSTLSGLEHRVQRLERWRIRMEHAS